MSKVVKVKLTIPASRQALTNPFFMSVIFDPYFCDRTDIFTSPYKADFEER